MFNLFGNKNKEEEKPAACPYCKAELNPPPTRKKKCPHCGQSFNVRTHYETKERLVLTEDQTKIYDIEKDEYYRVKRFVDSFKNIIDFDDALIDRMVKEEEKELTQRFDKPASFADVAWGVSNKLIVKRPDLASQIHFNQALFLHECGKDYAYVRERDLEDELKKFKKQGFKKVSIITAKEQSCSGCRALENKMFTIEEALKEKLLPCRNCSFKFNQEAPTGWCRCLYAVEFD